MIEDFCDICSRFGSRFRYALTEHQAMRVEPHWDLCDRCHHLAQDGGEGSLIELFAADSDDGVVDSTMRAIVAALVKRSTWEPITDTE